MRSKTRLLVWLGFVFLLFLAGILWLLRGKEPWLNIAAEILIPLAYAFTVVLVTKIHQPIQTIAKSMSLLREEDFSVTLVKTGNPDVDRIVGVYNAMITRLREERLSVREKNHFLDLLIESSPTGIIIADYDERIMDVNPAACAMLGIPDGKLKGARLKEVQNPMAIQLAELPYQDKKTMDGPDGKKFLCRKLFFMDHGFRHPFYLMEEFSDEIREAEKAAYGKLIRMMAHEVNNTVGAVNSIMTTVLDNRKTIVPEEQDEVAGMLEVAVQRNYRLNRFMQNFSDVVKLPKPEKEPFDLNASLISVVNSFSPVLTEKAINTRLDLSESSPALLADQSQMEQVFINLIKNSIEAIGSKGTLMVCTLTDPVRIRICDDGPGLSPHIHEKLFTPFFSTKTDGQGIGLTLVREILTNHGFTFRFANREEGGTVFEITAP